MLNRISAFINLGKADSLKRRLIKGAVGSFGLKIAGTGLTFVKSLIFARLLGTEGFGIYAYAITWVALLSIPAKLGLSQLIVREVAIYQTQSEWGLMRGFLSWSNQIVLVVSIGLVLIAGGIAWNSDLEINSQMLLTFGIALISLPISSLTHLRLSAMQGLHQVVLGQLPEVLIAPMLLIILTGSGYLILKEDLNASWVMGMYVVAMSITFLIGAHLLNRSLPNLVKDAVPKYQVKKWLSSGLPLMFLGAMNIINSQTDVLMLGAMKGAESVGIYAVINRLSSLIIFVLAATNSILAPNIATLYAEGKIEKLQKMITKSSRVVFLASLIITSILIIFAYWLLLIFGSDFTQGKNALIILCIGQLVNAAVGPVALLLNMTGNENYTTISIGTSAVLNVILNILLIPRWGIEGAAIATTSSMIVWNIISFVWVKNKLGINSIAFGK
ncbi:MAG: flippase [Nostocales cyanobacterium 94392]|nr:flippase [Nostocales cyanobacterium 94392]